MLLILLKSEGVRVVWLIRIFKRLHGCNQKQGQSSWRDLAFGFVTTRLTLFWRCIVKNLGIAKTGICSDKSVHVEIEYIAPR